MAGGSVTYQWSIVSQQPAPPAPANAAVASIFNPSLTNAAVLNGINLTGVVGSATLRCAADVRATAGGDIKYTSTQDFVVTVTPAIVQPAVAPASILAFCTTTDTRQLTASAAGASQMKWWTTDGSIRFSNAANPTGVIGTPAAPFVTSATGAGGNSVVTITSVSATNGVRLIRVQAFNDARWCTPSQVTEYSVLYGVTLEPQPLTVTATNTDFCHASYAVTLPRILGATGYTWELIPNYGYQMGQYTATITGSPWVGVNQPDPPQWQMTPINEASFINPTGFRSSLIVGLNYQGENACGTGEYGGGSYSLFLRAVNGSCAYRLAPSTPGDEPLVSASPIPADDELRVIASGTGPTVIELLDAYGQLRLTHHAESAEATLNTRALPNGPYVLRVRRGESVETRRIAIQH